MYFLFAVSIFLSSTLIFSIQLIVGKDILPLFGGAPLLWSTAVMFFQLVLLAGYFYAHVLSKVLKPKIHAMVHVGLVAVTLTLMHITFSYADRFSEEMFRSVGPYFYILILLFVSIALPFFVLSTTSPLLQRWFAEVRKENGKNPYTLYVASNIGSFLPLIFYPIIIEPVLSLELQKNLWIYLFYIFAIFLAVCGLFFVYKTKKNLRKKDIDEENIYDENIARPNYKQKLKWVLLSFIPSSLMLGVTLFITDDMDITPGPFFWVVPMALYFISFAIVFAKKPIISAKRSVYIMLTSSLIIVPYFFANLRGLEILNIFFHLVAFFFICLAGHGVLVEQKPGVKYLTSFYMYLAIGGALGGIFNSLIAPFIFRGVIEYPLVIALALFVIPIFKFGVKEVISLRSATIGILMLVILIFPMTLNMSNNVMIMLVLIWCIFVTSLISHRSFSVAVIFIVLTTGFWSKFYLDSSNVYIKRDFFGVNKVSVSWDGNHMLFTHGNTVHGKQRLDDSLAPTTYYHKKGPLGEFFEATSEFSDNWTVGGAGLGIGSMLYFSRPTQNWVYYEISPTVIEIASNEEFFGYVSEYEPLIKEGDARKLIEREEDGYFDLLILDAYSSDNIPLHLLTSEAFDTYISKLSKDGFIATNISNRRLDLRPVFAAVAENKGLEAYYKRDVGEALDVPNRERYPSMWVVMSKAGGLEGLLGDKHGWEILENTTNFSMWTDDYSSVLRVMNF